MALTVVNRRTGNAVCRIETRFELRDFCKKKSEAGVAEIGLRGFLCGVVYHGVYDTKILGERIAAELRKTVGDQL